MIENSSEDKNTKEKTTEVKTENDNKDLNDKVCYFFRTVNMESQEKCLTKMETKDVVTIILNQCA